MSAGQLGFAISAGKCWVWVQVMSGCTVVLRNRCRVWGWELACWENSAGLLLPPMGMGARAGGDKARQGDSILSADLCAGSGDGSDKAKLQNLRNV